MAKRRDTNLLQRNDHVIAAEDLRYVPAGTRGRVLLANGFAWKRYWVNFDNGVDMGSISRDQLVLVDKSGEPIAVGS